MTPRWCRSRVWADWEDLAVDHVERSTEQQGPRRPPDMRRTWLWLLQSRLIGSSDTRIAFPVGGDDCRSIRWSARRPFPRRVRTGKSWRRSPSLLGGLGWSPRCLRFWEHLGINGTHFWKALTLFSTCKDRLKKGFMGRSNFLNSQYSKQRQRPLMIAN